MRPGDLGRLGRRRVCFSLEARLADREQCALHPGKGDSGAISNCLKAPNYVAFWGGILESPIPKTKKNYIRAFRYFVLG